MESGRTKPPARHVRFANRQQAKDLLPVILRSAAAQIPPPQRQKVKAQRTIEHVIACSERKLRTMKFLRRRCVHVRVQGHRGVGIIEQQAGCASRTTLPACLGWGFRDMGLG
jgi:hypothetical protein